MIDKKKIKVALFDMDGVLYDSMGYHAISWKESMAEYGLHMTEQDAYRCEGMRGVETIRLISQREGENNISEEEAQKMYRTKSEHFAKFPVASLIPGIKDVHQSLLDKNVRIGVVTGSGQPSLLNRLLNDFSGYLDENIIVTANDVTHGKPAPDPYLQGMKKAGTTPNETIVIENAPLGIRSAVAAGCHCIAVNTGPLPDNDLLDEGAELLFHNMMQLREWIIENL